MLFEQVAGLEMSASMESHLRPMSKVTRMKGDNGERVSVHLVIRQSSPLSVLDSSTRVSTRPVTLGSIQLSTSTGQHAEQHREDHQRHDADQLAQA